MGFGTAVRAGRVLGLVSLCCLVPASAAAQTSVTLDGVVRHEGVGVANAQLTATLTATSERRATSTNEHGYFRLLDLSPGTYSISVRALGFTPETRSVRVGTGDRIHLAVELRRGPMVLQEVTVSPPDATGHDIRRMSVSTSVTEQEIANLPLNSRNVMELAAVAPGIRSFRPVRGQSLPSAGALRGERFLNLYLDGMEMKNLYDGNLVGMPQTGSPLPPESLQEFRVLINPYDAEYAHAASYVISAVSRRGTNDRRGSVFGYFQNRHFVSTNQFQRAIPNFERPDFRRQQIGFNASGPILRDRLFYAASYELSDTENFVAVVPGQPVSDPSHWDEYAGVFRAPDRNHTGLLRLTYATGPAGSLDLIWSTRRRKGDWMFGGITAYNAVVAEDYAINTLNLRHRWVPAVRFANDLSVQFVGWSHVGRAREPSPELFYPTLRLGRSGSGFEIDESHFRLVNRSTWSFGAGPRSHLMKVGVELSRVSLDHLFGVNRYGLFEFNDVNTEPRQATIAVGINDPNSDRDALAGIDGWVVGAYLNDEWRVTSRLVLNLGLRYDAELNTLNNDFTVPWAADTALSLRPELRGLLNRGDRRNDLNNVSPRVSFSWDVRGSGRLFLRGGLGIVYDRVPAFTALQERRAATWRTYVFQNPGTTDPEELRRRVIEGGATAAPPSITLLPARMQAPENRQLSLGLGLQIAPSWSLNTDYIRQDVRHLFAEVNLNWRDASQFPPRRVLSADYADIVAWGDFARARYDALLTRLSYSPDSSSQFHLSHTLGFARADWDVANVAVPAAVADQYYTMQRTSGDERHRFVLSGTSRFRFGLGVSLIATAASPRPFRARVGQDLNRNGFFDDDRIDGRRYQLPADKWANWYRVVDVRLTQPVPIARATLLLTAEAFNLFNTENYASYFDTQRSPSGEPQPQFGQPREVFGTRQMQLGARLVF
jgi:hypothetical protein